MVAVCLLYTQVQNGLSTASQPAEHLTAGKLSKVCPHQVNTILSLTILHRIPSVKMKSQHKTSSHETHL